MPKTPTDIRTLARSHTETAIKMLHGIMTQAKAPPAARVAAAQALLDRGWGKAPQHISGEFSQRYVAELPAVCEDGDEWERRYSPKRH
jgi:hypothetical protein